MRYRPIIFDGESVRAILEGPKTQTRRVVKPQLPVGADTLRDIPGENRWWAAYSEKNEFGTAYRPLGGDQQHEWRCPYGVPGDRLWVRETWQVRNDIDGVTDFDGHGKTAYYVRYRATGVVEDSWERHSGLVVPLKREPFPGEWDSHWRSPRYIPRWASRLTLEVTGVRVERLQEITPKEVFAEGLDLPSHAPWTHSWSQFERRWDALNANRGYPWESNPWVWAIDFRRAA